jgi:hypothetical protein
MDVHTFTISFKAKQQNQRVKKEKKLSLSDNPWATLARQVLTTNYPLQHQTKHQSSFFAINHALAHGSWVINQAWVLASFVVKDEAVRSYRTRIFTEPYTTFVENVEHYVFNLA